MMATCQERDTSGSGAAPDRGRTSTARGDRGAPLAPDTARDLPTDDREARVLSEGSVLAAAPITTVPLITDDDAYFHPGGRIRSMNGTDGWNVDATLTPAATVATGRRRSWLAAGLLVVLGPLALLPAVLAIREHAPPAPPRRAERIHTAETTSTGLARADVTRHAVLSHAATAAPPAPPPPRARHGKAAPSRRATRHASR
jgi:hypothetical protein